MFSRFKVLFFIISFTGSMLSMTPDYLKYREEVLAPAFKVVTEWDVNEAERVVGDPFEVNLCYEDFEGGSVAVANRLSIYSQGMALNLLDFNNEFPKHTKIFSQMKKKDPTNYPGDYFIANPRSAGEKNPQATKLLSFGQREDAFRLIYSLNKLRQAGIKELNIDAMCYGTLRVINAMYALAYPHKSSGAVEFFEKANMDRIDREKMLSMLRTINFQASLKLPSDTVGARMRPMAMGAIALKEKAMGIVLDDSGRKKIYDGGAIGKTLFYLIAPRTTSMAFSSPTVYEMLASMEYFKREYPLIAYLYLPKNKDIVVGDWDIDTFFDVLPAENDRKYLIPSHDENHKTLDEIQIWAKNALAVREGGSYYNVPRLLTFGSKILQFAQKNQYNSTETYIEFMSKKENYAALLDGNFNFMLPPARL
jgi:hypothetical protein